MTLEWGPGPALFADTPARPGPVGGRPYLDTGPPIAGYVDGAPAERGAFDLSGLGVPVEIIGGGAPPAELAGLGTIPAELPGQLAMADDGQLVDPAELPGPAAELAEPWGRFTWGLICDVFDLLDRNGYRRGTARDVGHAITLLGDAANAYEGRPSGFPPAVPSGGGQAEIVADLRTPGEVAAQFGVCVKTIRRWALDPSKDLRALKLPGGQVRYHGVSVDLLYARAQAAGAAQ